jgi:hypothetical protein
VKSSVSLNVKSIDAIAYFCEVTNDFKIAIAYGLIQRSFTTLTGAV